MDLCYTPLSRKNDPLNIGLDLQGIKYPDFQSCFNILSQKCFVNRGPGMVVYLSIICEETLCTTTVALKEIQVGNGIVYQEDFTYTGLKAKNYQNFHVFCCCRFCFLNPIPRLQ